MKALRANKQKVWRMPAVMNFTLGGLGAGMYVIGSLISLFVNLEPSIVFIYKVTSPILVLFGLYFVALEAGKPFKARFLLKNIRKSWMSRESLGIYLFLLIIVLDLTIGNPLLNIAGVIIASFILFSHGMILYKSKGIPAWNVKIIVPLFMVSSLTSGSALMLFISVLNGYFAYHQMSFTLILLVGSMVLWLSYLYYNLDPDTRFSTRALRSKTFLTLNVLMGHLVPAIGIIGYSVIVDIFNPGMISFIFLIIIVLLIISGSFLIRYGIILNAGYFRRVVLYKNQ
jgi:DMSO reductase anchor subunit